MLTALQALMAGLWQCATQLAEGANQAARDLRLQLQGGGASRGAAELQGRLDAALGCATQMLQRYAQEGMQLLPAQTPRAVLVGHANRESARFAAEAGPPMRSLAAAMRDYWRRPEQQAQAAAAVELAAAKRPCANLRCAALGSTAKSRRCGSCKVSRYCCVDCQRAAWTAGHRHGCAQLPALLAAAAQHPS